MKIPLILVLMRVVAGKRLTCWQRVCFRAWATHSITDSWNFLISHSVIWQGQFSVTKHPNRNLKVISNTLIHCFNRIKIIYYSGGVQDMKSEKGVLSDPMSLQAGWMKM